MQPLFPVVFWGATRVEFFATEASPMPEASPTVALVYALQGKQFVLADIAGRGWCIPGGGIETGETPEQAAHREVYEEIGGKLEDLRRIGWFLLTNTATGDRKLVIAFLAHVLALGPLPAGTESQGIRLATLEELPHHYYLWDPLIEASFIYAFSLFSSSL